MNKQDLIAPRTPEHLQRMYAFDRQFSELNKSITELASQVKELSARLEAIENASNE